MTTNQESFVDLFYLRESIKEIIGAINSSSVELHFEENKCNDLSIVCVEPDLRFFILQYYKDKLDELNVKIMEDDFVKETLAERAKILKEEYWNELNQENYESKQPI